jgi:hypothetical protein
LTSQDIRSNQELRDNLNLRVCMLMLVMIEPLKGKKPDEIPQDLKRDIEQLTS